jgi:predicted glycosyltransferase
MTRIWLDPLTPKQALFCSRLCERFDAEGFEVVYTTREYPEATGKLELLGIKAQVVGKHGGANRYEKLLASAERVVELAKYINSLEVDLAFSFASPEGARVAFGLGIPYFTANDSPHSHFVAKLTIPLAIRLFTPWIMEKLWLESDIPKAKIITYHGLDPVAWLQDFTPNPQVLTELSLNADSEYVVIRPEEAQAAYLYEKGDESNPVINPVIKAILDEYPDLQIVVLCRYPRQREAIREAFGEKVILPESVIDAPSLLSSAQLLVGAGGTMNQEASLLGVPVIACFPGEPLITDEYFEKEQLLYRSANPDEAARKALEILEKRHQYRKAHQRRAETLLQQMENPIDIIFTQLLGYIRENLEKK